MDGVCEQCGRKQEVLLIVCPQCELPCCDDCIAGRGVICFTCENEDEVSTSEEETYDV